MPRKNDVNEFLLHLKARDADARQEVNAFLANIFPELSLRARLASTTWPVRATNRTKDAMLRGIRRWLRVPPMKAGLAMPGLPTLRPTGGRSNSAPRNVSRARKIARVGKRLTAGGLAMAVGSVVMGNIAETALAGSLEPQIQQQLAKQAGLAVTTPLGGEVYVSPVVDPDHAAALPLTQAQRESENFEHLINMVVRMEDRRLEDEGAFFSIGEHTRVLGADLPGVVQGLVSQFGDDPRGGSTLNWQICGIARHELVLTTQDSGWVEKKVLEALCGLRLELETGSDKYALGGLLMDYAPLVTGGRGSGFGPEVKGVRLASQLLFGRPFEDIEYCEVAFLVTALNRPFVVLNGPMTEANEARFAKQMERTHWIVNLGHGRAIDAPLDAGDAGCATGLQRLNSQTYVNPASALNVGFGHAANQVRLEAIDLRRNNPDAEVLKVDIEPLAQDSARDSVVAAACDIQNRRALWLNICLEGDRSIDNAYVRVHAVHIGDGRAHRSIALGQGRAHALRESTRTGIGSRGSIEKALFVPILHDATWCRLDYPELQDPDRITGYSRPCTQSQFMSADAVVKYSLNQPFLWAFERSDPVRVSAYLDELGYTPGTTHRELTLGLRPLPAERMLAAYLASTQPGRVGREAHFIDGTDTGMVDLTDFITEDDVTRTREILAAPLERGGTAYTFGRALRAQGYRVNFAKTGSSEANATDLRGRHVAAEVVTPAGETLLVFAEIASSDAAAIAPSGGISGADLAQIIIAALG